MSSRTRIAVIAAAVLVVAGVIGYIAWNGDRKTTAVTIAGNIPLTGPIAATTGQYPNGVTMGVDEACQRFDIRRDVFRIDFQDNAGKPTDAVSLFQQQQLRGFNVYFSGTSECSLAVAPLVDETGKPHFTLAFDPFFVYDKPNRLRILPNSRIEGPLFVQYAKSKQARSVYVLHVNSAYANSEWNDIIASGLKEAGIEAQAEAYDFGQRDFKTLAPKGRAGEGRPDLRDRLLYPPPAATAGSSRAWVRDRWAGHGGPRFHRLPLRRRPKGRVAGCGLCLPMVRDNGQGPRCGRVERPVHTAVRTKADLSRSVRLRHRRGVGQGVPREA